VEKLKELIPPNNSRFRSSLDGHPSFASESIAIRKMCWPSAMAVTSPAKELLFEAGQGKKRQ